MTGRKPKPLKDRFLEKVDKNGENGCWIWLGARYLGEHNVDQEGKSYGRVRIRFGTNNHKTIKKT